MTLPPAHRCAWCGGVLRSVEERRALRCWLCALLDAWRRQWVRN